MSVPPSLLPFNCASHSRAATVTLPFIIAMTTAPKINNRRGSDHMEGKFTFSTLWFPRKHTVPPGTPAVGPGKGSK